MQKGSGAWFIFKSSEKIKEVLLDIVLQCCNYLFIGV